MSEEAIKNEKFAQLDDILVMARNESGKDFPIRYNQIDSYPTKITITEVENGFLVRVGCKEFVFQSKKDLFDAIENYIDAPEDAEKKYCK